MKLSKIILSIVIIFTVGCTDEFTNGVSSSLLGLLNNGSGFQIYGQPNELTNLNANGGISSPRGITVIGNQVFVSSYNEGRILVWNNISPVNFPAPDFALGAPSTHMSHAKSFLVPTDGNHYVRPTGIHTDGTRFAMAIRDQHRVLLWNSMPTGNTPPDVVLGQADFSGASINGGLGRGSATASTLSFPEAVYIHNDMLIVADWLNWRVLIWTTFPTTNGQPADIVLGQPDMTSIAANALPNAAKIAEPSGILVVGDRLFIAPFQLKRIMIWNDINSLGNGQVADTILGIDKFPLSDDETMNPWGLTSDGTRLAVASAGENRVLIWNNIATLTDNQPADLVIGQTDMIANTPHNGGVTAATMGAPRHIASDGTRLYVTDSEGHRVLVWNSFPTTNGQAADWVINQPDMLSARHMNRFDSINPNSLSFPSSVFKDDQYVYIASQRDHRVTIYNNTDFQHMPPAQIVLGQVDKNSDAVRSGGSAAATITASASTLSSPGSVCSNGQEVFVADNGHNRILMWNNKPSSDGQAADLVLGQADMLSSAPNAGGAVSANGLNFNFSTNPYQIYCDSTYLVIPDIFNNRVLIWNSIPTSNNEPADVVLGQADMFSALTPAAQGGTSASTIGTPFAVWIDQGRLFVSDITEGRVLIWNTIPTSNNAPADVVVGQPDMGPSALPFDQRSFAFGIAARNNKLYLADLLHHRIQVWNSIPTSNGVAPDQIIGQANSTDFRINGGLSTLGVDTFHRPGGLFLDSIGILYVADMYNNRVIAKYYP